MRLIELTLFVELLSDQLMLHKRDGGLTMGNVLAAITDAMEDSEPHMVELPRWIPVTERLPMGSKDGEVSENVIAWFVDKEIGNQVCAGWLNHDTWYLVVGLDDYHTKHRFESVTHWMPLPEPPKEG